MTFKAKIREFSNSIFKKKSVSSEDVETIHVYVKPNCAVEFIDMNFKVLPTGTEFASDTKLANKVKNMRKRKFISIAEKTPELVKEWDELGNGISADKVPHALKAKAMWNCQFCGAKYERRIDNRTRRPEPGCTKCIIKKKSPN